MMLIVLSSGATASFFTYRHSDRIIVPISIFVGSYLLVRGISIMIGGVPQSLSMFGDSNSVLAFFYYILAYIFTIGLGYAFQKHNHFDDIHELECDSDHSDEEGEEKEDDHEHDHSKPSVAANTGI